jgi:gluconate 2-dehydrogenase gamma chain
MKRRENLKLLVASGFGAGLLIHTEACKPDAKDATTSSSGSKVYGRTPEEIEHDKKVMAMQFFTDHEMKTVTVLGDIIIPKDDISGSASEAGVPAFIEFMMNDQPWQQLPMRGGLHWLDNQCRNRYTKAFVDCDPKQQIEIIDLIAYPDKATPDMKAGVKFFNQMRNMVATGFYTSQMGIKDIGYKGNVANEWDGVPEEVMKKHGLELDPKYKDLYVKPSERNTVMTWDS